MKLTDMKKKYQAPVLSVVYVQTQQMIAASLTENYKNANSETNGVANSRRGGWFDDDDE